MRILDLGCGHSDTSRRMWPDAEIVRVDNDPDVLPDVLADVCGLPGDLGQFDAILAAHILEHLPRTAAIPALKHWLEFLKPGGELHLMVPDLVWAAEELVRQRASVHVLMHIYGAQSDAHQEHHFGYTMILLRDAIDRAGYIVKSAQTARYGIRYPAGTDPVVARMLYVVAVKP